MTALALESLFWISAACVAYTYLGYPIFMGLLARFRGRPVHPSGRHTGSISIVLVAYNEDKSITRRVDELATLLADSAYEGEVMVVSDGSTDKTAEFAKSRSGKSVRVLELPENVGKAEALTSGCEASHGDVIVFADARQRWAPDALEKLVRNFSVPEVGAVSGDLRIDTSLGIMSGVGLYWRYEKWLRRNEGIVHSTIGVTGAISAVRRKLFRPIPRGTVLDDVYWPLQVVMQGYRVIHEEQAVAFDHLPERAQDEFRRKMRTLSGNFQLLTRLPSALLPWRNPVALEFISHKVMRLIVPWALLGACLASAMLSHPLYRVAFGVQVVLYILGLFGALRGTRPQPRLTAAAGSFIVLNAAAWLAFWIWASGKAGSSWGKARYRHGIAPE